MRSYWLLTSGKLVKLVFLFCFATAFLRVHLRVQTTMVGYEIGRLKNKEGKLLEDRSELKMELARMTTKHALSLMAEGDGTENGTSGTLAAK